MTFHFPSKRKLWKLYWKPLETQGVSHYLASILSIKLLQDSKELSTSADTFNFLSFASFLAKLSIFAVGGDLD